MADASAVDEIASSSVLSLRGFGEAVAISISYTSSRRSKISAARAKATVEYAAQ